MSVGRKICLQGYELKGFASLLSRLLSLKGWSYTEFAKRCTTVARNLGYREVYEGSQDKIRNRLASIMTCHAESKHNDTSNINWDRAAKQLYEDEIEVFSQTLGVHAAWLECAGLTKAGIQWSASDANRDPAVDHLTVMTAIYEEMTAEMTVVSRIIPGELLPEELMFSYLEAINQSRQLFPSKSALHRYGAFANDRRLRLQSSSRISHLYFILPFEQIEAALLGQGVFAGIDGELRDTVATHLAEVVSNSPSKTHIAFPKQEQFDQVMEPSSTITLSCGDMFTLQYLDHGNVKYWTGRSAKTVQNSRLLNEIILAAG